MKSRTIKRNKKKQIIEKTRKQLRKEKRQQKKINRAQYYAKKKNIPGKFVLNPECSSDEKFDVTAKKIVKNNKNHNKIKNNGNTNTNNNNKNVDVMQRELKKEKLELKHLQNQMKKHRKIGLIEDNEKEDKEIKHLEKQLRLNKRKSKTVPKSFVDDGLDYLLDFCDGENRRFALETEKQLLGVDIESDFDEDFEMVTKGVNVKNTLKKSKTKHDVDEELLCKGDEESSDDDNKSMNSEFSDMNENDYPSGMDTNDNLSEIDANEDFSDEDEDDNDLDQNRNHDKIQNESEDDEDKNVTEGEENGTWYDIYGRKRDSSGHVISEDNKNKYIPPAARLQNLKKSSTDEEKLARLKKQLKGLVNRLAEFNLHSIALQIEELYMSNSRNDMNELISTLLLESIVSTVMTPDRLIAEHMLLVTVLHANVGTEVGAHFLLTVVKKIDELIETTQDVENKEVDNLILMLSHLYNFKIYASQLIYQILDKLIDKFTEKEIELILLILKTIGFQLRKDDPLALKHLILKIQQKAKSTESSNSRIQFMLDVLLAIKNNNMNKIPQYDPTHVEHLKKILKSFLRKGNTVTQLNISLTDLLTSNERGKWWVVGSAWTGTINNTQNEKVSDTQVEYSEKLLELARKQRMNTEIRKNIFCILMTAEDYLDAFEKISRLNLRDQQQREIISVIMKCCLQEKVFNPYYAVLAQKFCDSDRKYQMSLQYSLWDKLKTLNTYTNVQIHNLSKFLIYLFIEKGLPLTVLKVIEFGELDKPTMRLLRQTMFGILLHDNTEACLQVFERIPTSPQLQMLREGLRLFINHFLLKNVDSKSFPEQETKKLVERGEIVDKILYKRSSKTLL
ncbi:nucleolar MIF4G domain-containing protein 1 [Chelonus insularis]|uniref:nucleolar MIF4G domain-containing protein 1 n=1 Tax=Chelonus insularis TaxID=460826 RepID=UPI00158D2EF5|nr:nucleolar MIF4G domain-containing protein 1 [Chelonus insularis]